MCSVVIDISPAVPFRLKCSQKRSQLRTQNLSPSALGSPLCEFLPTLQPLHLKTFISSQPSSELSLERWNRTSAPDHLLFVYLQQPLVTRRCTQIRPHGWPTPAHLPPSLRSYLPRHFCLDAGVAAAWAFDQNFMELCSHHQQDTVLRPITSPPEAPYVSTPLTLHMLLTA